jgi:hypothetical protein
MIYFVLLVLALLIFTLLKIKDKKLLESVTKSHRGTKTERKLVLKLLKAGFPAQTLFHDLYITKNNGTYSQVDLVLATKVGLIVFEVKNYSGWIFGNGNQKKWTQVLAFGRQKYYFYNPVLQNKTHIEIIKSTHSDLQEIPCFSVLVFYGNCEFRNVGFIPNDTFVTKSHRVLDIVNKIIEENKIAYYKSKREVVAVLKAAVENGNDEIVVKKHVQNIKNMLGKHI